MGILNTRAGDRYRTKHPNTHPINSSTSPAIRASAARGRKKDTRATTPKDTMMRQTKGRVAALIVAVFCVLGLIWIPHQALAQGSSSESRSSSIAGSAYNGFGNAVGTARSGSYSNFGATDTFTDTNGYSFNGAAINNADAFASSFRPYYGGYGSIRCTAIGC